MTSLKKISATLAVALILPLAASTASFAQRGSGAPGGGGAVGAGGGGGGGFGGGRGGGIGGGAGPVGGGFAGGGHAAAISGGGFAARGGMGGPGPSIAASPGGRFAAAGPTVAGRGSWAGGGWRGGRWHHRGGGFWPGVAVGAALGSYAYYGGPDYYWDYGPDYYTDYSYYDDSAPVAVVGGDASYCARRYRSYDPASGTYLGYDGLRHPCP